ALAWIDTQLTSGQHGSNAPWTPLEAALREHAQEIVRQSTQPLMQWLLGMVEDPAKRWKAAEGGARRLLELLAAAAESSRTERAEIHGRIETFRRQLLSGELEKKGSGARRRGLWRRSDPRVSFMQGLV